MSGDGLHLPEHFDGSNAREVTDALLKRRGAPLELNGARVATAGALGIQVLISTSKQWQEDGFCFRLLSASDAVIRAIESLGVAPEDIGIHDYRGAS